MLRAARGVVDLAERAGLCRHSIRKWETSSHAIPAAMYAHLCRVADILEDRRWPRGTATFGENIRLSSYLANPLSKNQN